MDDTKIELTAILIHYPRTGHHVVACVCAGIFAERFGGI